ncbi:MAG: ParB/RepB/Spo0J family partition protein [Anaerovibrio sp.]|nr:ParB/RepB/Spo0J family partition protein [Anaerovibrio sp.]
MAKKIGGLGKGLGAFGLHKSAQKPSGGSEQQGEWSEDASRQPVLELALELLTVNPNQPRSEFSQESLESLEASIKQYGVLQPVLVRKTVKGYELIAGERRLRAARQAGLKTIPAIVREYNDAQMTEVALIENIQRENLNPVEEAQAYQHLLSDYGLTQDMLAHKVGRSRSHIANFLRLLNLSAKVQKMLTEGSIAMGQARPLLALENLGLQEQAAEFIAANELSARRAEGLVKELQKHPDYFEQKEQQPDKEQNGQADIYYAEMQDKLKMLLGTNVRIKKSGKKQRLEIDFASPDELGQLIELLEGINGTRPAANTREDKLAMLRQFSTTGKFSV